MWNLPHILGILPEVFSHGTKGFLYLLGQTGFYSNTVLIPSCNCAYCMWPHLLAGISNMLYQQSACPIALFPDGKCLGLIQLLRKLHPVTQDHIHFET